MKEMDTVIRELPSPKAVIDQSVLQANYILFFFQINTTCAIFSPTENSDKLLHSFYDSIITQIL